MRNSQRRQLIQVSLLKLYGRHCHWCGDRMTFKPFQEKSHKETDMTIEHLVCRAEGGSNEIENLRLACYGCNQERSKLEEQQSWWRKYINGGIA